MSAAVDVLVLATDHTLPGLPDRQPIVVQTAARKLASTFGPGVGLVRTSCARRMASILCGAGESIGLAEPPRDLASFVQFGGAIVDAGRYYPPSPVRVISMRRFFARPSGVSFEATG
jgi:hypothetical protein